MTPSQAWTGTTLPGAKLRLKISAAGRETLESQKHVVVVTMSDSERQETFMKSGQKFYGLGNQNNFLFFGIFDETFGYNKFVCKLFFWSKMLFTPRGASQIKVVGENLLLSIETSLGAIFNNCNKTHNFPCRFFDRNES